MTIKHILLATVATALFSAPAFAQEEPPADDGAGLEEIVVTAQKREQNLQNVPVSVTALSAEAIANQRIAEFSDLTRAAPSLTITQATSSPNNSIILRGIGTFAFSIGVEPSVAVIIDDMPVVQQAQAFDNLSDVQRIEVLKGPQGTLFGKNSSAGVVNIVTKDPGHEFEGSVSVSAATDGDVRAEASVSAPLGAGAGIRLTGFYHDYPGNIHNLTTGGNKLNQQENYGIRGKLKAELGDTFTATLIGAYSKATQAGTVSSIRDILGTGTPRVLGNAAFPLVPSLTGITPGAGNFNARVDALGATKNETASIAGKLNLDLGFANLISVTAYQDWKYNFQNDVDNTDININGTTPGGGIVQSGPYHSRNFTQELRLVSSGHGPLKYVAGIFYADAKTTRAFARGPALAANWSAENQSKSLGLFAQLDYTLPTNTTISGGIRYNHEKINVAFDNLLASAVPNTCATGNPLCRGENTDSVVTWKASISQDLAPQVMVYGSVARGYKGFAYDVSSNFNPARINAALNGTGAGLIGVGPVKPETSTSWELGLKSRFLDNRIQLNIVGFLANYTNFQAQSAIIVNNAPQFVLNNVGKLRTKGVDIEFSAKPSDWLRIDAGASYTDAIMTQFLGAQGYPGQPGTAPNCTTVFASGANAGLCQLQNRSGSRLPNSPKFKWNLGATADFPLGGDAKGTFIVNYQHQSDVNFDLLGSPYLTQKSYGIFNASLGAEFGRFKVVAFVNNLFNKHYAAGLADNFGTLGGNAANDTHVIYQVLPRDSQRFGGIKATVSF